MVRQCLVPYPTVHTYPTLPYPTLPYRTVPYPTLPYPYPNPNLEPTTQPHPHPTHNPDPLHRAYRILPYPTPTLRLSCHTTPCPALPYPSAVHVGLFRSVSVVLLSISVSESGLVLSFRFVSLQSVKVKAIGTDRMNSVKSVDSMPELSKLYNCRFYKCRIVTC